VKPGLGPRHIAIGSGNKFAYLVCEMGSTVVAFSYDHSTGALKVLQTISTLPDGFSGVDNSGEIQIDATGRFLYASNRGNDSITLFRIDPRDGLLTKVQVTPTQGQIPRHFTIDPSGKFLIAENQASDTMVVFKISQTDGELTPTGDVIKTPAPCWIAFVPVP
jgi:6-phosphogluconolactonase